MAPASRRARNRPPRAVSTMACPFPEGALCLRGCRLFCMSFLIILVTRLLLTWDYHGVGTGVGITTVAVRVAVREAVEEGTLVRVGVSIGVTVRVAVRVAVEEGTLVRVGVTIGVTVRVAVRVAVEEGTLVRVGTCIVM